jgi:hypothetical protein
MRAIHAFMIFSKMNSRFAFGLLCIAGFCLGGRGGTQQPLDIGLGTTLLDGCEVSNVDYVNPFVFSYTYTILLSQSSLESSGMAVIHPMGQAA